MTLQALENTSGLASGSWFNIVPQSDSRIPIRLASTANELEAIYRFRYAIYTQDANLPQVYADGVKQTIEDPFDRCAYNFAAFKCNEVVGALRVNFSRDSDLDYYEKFLKMHSVGFYHPGATSICTRLMVAPQFRGSSVALRLAKASYAFALRHQIRYNFVDCSDRMIRFFERLGYVHQGCAEHPEYGVGNVMRLDLLDRVNLAQIQSPFLELLAARGGGPVPDLLSGLA